MPRNESLDPAYLWDMLDAAKAISAFIAGSTFHDFQTDRMLPWRNIIGQRNILIHEYGEVKIERIWIVATEKIPELVVSLKPLLPQASTKTDQP